jgi:short-subunit dehydrogenase
MPSVLITGSSKGLGKSLALEFSKNNYHVIINGRDEKALNEIKSIIKEGCTVIIGDIADNKTVERLAIEAEKRDIEVLINNAGYYLNKPVEESDDEEIRKIFEINFFSIVNLTRKIIPIFKNKKSGLIININSLAGKLGSKQESFYSASKHALKGFSDSIKQEILEKGIRVLDVYLGAMSTEMTKNRKDYDFFINPNEAAGVIFNAINDKSSLYISEMDIRRRRYNTSK